MMIKVLLENWNKYLLLELDYDEIKSKLDGDKFARTANYHGLSPEEAKKSIMKTLILNPETGQELDISDQDKANYLNWRIKQFMTKGSSTGPDSQNIETFYQIKAQKLDRFLEINDINQFESVEKFDEIVSKAKVIYDSYVAEKAKKSRKGNWIDLPSGVSFEVPETARLIAEDDNWLLYIPDSKGAAVGLGIHTSWCTAAPGLNYYATYHKPEKGDPLLDFISKNEKYSKKVIISTTEEIKVDSLGRKRKIKHHKRGEVELPVRYQISFGSEQYMDVNDRPIKGTAVYYQLMQFLNKNLDKLPEYVAKKSEQRLSVSLPNGGYKITEEGTTSYYDSERKLHREDGPALIGHTGIKKWYIHGVLHREDGPAEIDDRVGLYGGRVYREMWYNNGKLHREDGPAYIEKNNNSYRERWYKNGMRHRKNGPAEIAKANGIVVAEYWYLNDLNYREDGGPSIMRIDYGNLRQGDVKIISYTNKQGLKHRLDGPATIAKNLKTNKENYSFFIDGYQLSPKKYFDYLQKVRLEMPEPYYSEYLQRAEVAKKNFAKKSTVEIPQEQPTTQSQGFTFDFGDNT
jgi:hypothetical protein